MYVDNDGMDALIFGIVRLAYNDLFSDNDRIRGDAFVFFNKNTFGLSDRVLLIVKDRYRKESGKEWLQ